MQEKIKAFLAKDPNDDQIEIFYINHVLPYDKRSINEILETND